MNILKNQVYINPIFFSERVTERGENSHTLSSTQAMLSFTSQAMDVFLDMMITLVTINEKQNVKEIRSLAAGPGGQSLCHCLHQSKALSIPT